MAIKHAINNYQPLFLVFVHAASFLESQQIFQRHTFAKCVEDFYRSDARPVTQATKGIKELNGYLERAVINEQKISTTTILQSVY